MDSLHLSSRGTVELALEALPILVEVGEKLWTYFEHGSAEKRQAFADTLRRQVIWVPWERLRD